MALKAALIFVACSITFGFSVPVFSQQPNAAVLQMVNELGLKLGESWTVALNYEGTRIESAIKKLRHRYRPILLPRSKHLESDVINFVKENARFFQIPADMADLHTMGVNEGADPNGVARIVDTINFHQTFNGLPVFDRGIVVNIDRAEGIASIQCSYLPNINLPIIPRLSEQGAIAIALDQTYAYTRWLKLLKLSPSEFKRKQVSTNKPKLSLGIFVTEKETPLLVYSFDLKALSGLALTTYYIDANTGTIVMGYDLNKATKKTALPDFVG
jgi:Zn-dependent metalloprotease